MTNHVLAAVFPLLVIGILYARRSPDERMYASLLDTATHVVGVVSLAAMLTIATGSILGMEHPLGIAVRLWLFSTVYLGVGADGAPVGPPQAVRAEAFATPTLIIGAGMVGEHLVRRLVSEPRYGLRAGRIPRLQPDAAPERLRRRLRSGARWPAGPRPRRRADGRAPGRSSRSRPSRTRFSSRRVDECQRLGVEVALVPRLYESINERSHARPRRRPTARHAAPDRPARSGSSPSSTRSIASFAALALLALAPLMIAIAIAVRLTSPGPILFRQRRIGRDGHVVRGPQVPHDASSRAPLAPGSGPADGVRARRRRGRRPPDAPSAATCATSRSTSCPSSSTCCAAT